MSGWSLTVLYFVKNCLVRKQVSWWSVDIQYHLNSWIPFLRNVLIMTVKQKEQLILHPASNYYVSHGQHCIRLEKHWRSGDCSYMQFFDMNCSYSYSLTCPSVSLMWSLLACCSLQWDKAFVMMALSFCSLFVCFNSYSTFENMCKGCLKTTVAYSPFQASCVHWSQTLQKKWVIPLMRTVLQKANLLRHSY